MGPERTVGTVSRWKGEGKVELKSHKPRDLSQWDQNELLGPCQDGRGRGAIWEGKVELQSLKPTDFKPM